MEIDNIYNMDCLEGMKQIPDGTIDAVICDLPYGTMKGIVNAPGWGNCSCEWDSIIPTEPLFEQYERVLRKGGTIVLFSMEPYTSHLRTFKAKNIDFCYPMIWRKDSAGNALMSYKAPVSVFEDISVFSKRHDSQCLHPLRDYFSKLMKYMGVTSCKQINERLGHRRAEHSFYVTPDIAFGTANGSSQFALCTIGTYKELIDVYGIDKMEGYREWEDLLKDDIAFREQFGRVFNLPEGASQLQNVLDFKKDPREGIHPTQKPVALIRRLVLTYTNEGDTVLDNCMGSGTTAIACIKERRHFIGFELSKEYFDKAVRRIKAEQAQLTLF